VTGSALWSRAIRDALTEVLDTVDNAGASSSAQEWSLRFDPSSTQDLAGITATRLPTTRLPTRTSATTPPRVVSSPRRPVNQRSAAVVGGTSRGGPGGSASQRWAAAWRFRHQRVQLTCPSHLDPLGRRGRRRAKTRKAARSRGVPKGGLRDTSPDDGVSALGDSRPQALARQQFSPTPRIRRRRPYRPCEVLGPPRRATFC
jgi:hypothetical protein